MADGRSPKSSPRSPTVCADCAAVVPFTAHRAASTGHLDCLRLAVGRGASLVSSHGDTLLHVAALNGRDECLRWCLGEFKAKSLLMANEKGNFPLHSAMDAGNLNCIKTIFEAVNGRDADLPTDGVRAMMAKANKSGLSPIIIAVIHRQGKVVKYVVELFRDQLPGLVNNQCGATIFHYAAATGYMPIVEQLYAAYPSLALQPIPQTGVLPIYLAVQCGYLPCVQFLYTEVKSDLLALTRDRISTVHIAVQSGQLQCLKWLVNELSKDSSKDEVLLRGDKENATPFHFAAAFGQTKCMQYLLDTVTNQKAAVSAVDVWGRTPLHDAAEKNHANCLKLLLSAGGGLHVKDKENLSPYDFAMRSEKLRACVDKFLATQQGPVHLQVNQQRPQGSPCTSPAMARKESIRFTGELSSSLDMPQSELSTSSYQPVSVTISEDGQAAPGSSAAAQQKSNSVPDVAMPKQVAMLATATLQKSASYDTGINRCHLAQVTQGMDRSVSMEAVSIPHTRDVDAEQPRIRIVNVKGAPGRIFTEVNKLRFALEMFHAPVKVTTMSRDTVVKQLGTGPSIANLLKWLMDDIDCVLFICTQQLLDFFLNLQRGNKKSSASPQLSDSDSTLPAYVKQKIFAVVTMGGGSSRFRPPWLQSNHCYYWPKHQPGLFNKMGIVLPDHQLVPPTRQKRSNSNLK